MEVRFAVLADSANVSHENKLNIAGIFNRVTLGRFPGQHVGSSLVIALEAHPSVAGAHEIKIPFVDQDGTALMSVEVTLDLAEPDDRTRPIRANFIVPIPLIPLPSAGDDRFDVLVNGRHEAEIALAAQLRDD
jgi:hypothetical protein